MSRLCARAALALALAGCQANSDPARLYYLEEIRDAAATGGAISGLHATDFVTPRGATLAWESPPYASAPTLQRPDLDGSVIAPAFCEGAPAAYVTTEVWYEWGPVWLQPLYVLVTSYDARQPGAGRLPGALPIFSVGWDSSFYSPYWQMYFVLVPPDTAPAAITTTKQILDGNYPLFEGPTKLCPQALPDVFLAQSADGGLTRPLDGLPVGPVKRVQGYVEENVVDFFDFGSNRVTADATGAVVETPLFVFVRRGAAPAGSESDNGD